MSVLKNEMQCINVVLDRKDHDSFSQLVNTIRVEHGVSETEYSDSQIYRFFRGHKQKVPEALKAILANIEWRRNAPFDKAAALDLSKFDFVFEYVNLGFYGLDFEGRPIRIVRPLNFDPEILAKKYVEEERYLYSVQNIERILNIVFPLCSQKSGRYTEGMLSIVDISQVDMGKMFKSIGMMNTFKSSSKQFQDNYPEMAHKVIIINTGMLFKGLWNIIKLFINKLTLKKIVILGSDYMPELLKHTTKENLPTVIGGTCQHHINKYPNFFDAEYALSVKERRFKLN
jgi:hypothetical protein